jgi:hypothetical protein
MAKKVCGSCKHSKPTTQFSKYKRSKDGLQPHCKVCQSIRTRPLTNELLKANKNGIIYRIVNPLGETYIGCTKSKPTYRFMNHRGVYFNQKLKGYSTFPSLHKSFDIWGIDAHTFEVVKDMGDITKKALREVESRMIIALKLNGKCLNVNN